LDQVWAYPQSANIGITLDPERGNHVLAGEPKSEAARLGIRANDTLRRIGSVPIASVADVQFALHQGPKKGNLSIAWNTPTTPHSGVMDLKENWRRTDVSWRWSLKSLSPNPSIIGDDLDADGRKLLGIKPDDLAFRHMNFLTPAA